MEKDKCSRIRRSVKDNTVLVDHYMLCVRDEDSCEKHLRYLCEQLSF